MVSKSYLFYTLYIGIWNIKNRKHLREREREKGPFEALPLGPFFLLVRNFIIIMERDTYVNQYGEIFHANALASNSNYH